MVKTVESDSKNENKKMNFAKENKMESKKQLLETVAKYGGHSREYLEALFQNIPETAVKEITYCEFEKNEDILFAGDPSDTVFFLLKGQVIGLEHQKPGRVYSFMDFTRMNILGDFEAFSDTAKYGVTVRAAENCKLLRISKKGYLNWIRHDENALFLRLSNILSTLNYERKLDREYIFMDCKERLINYLVKLYEKEQADSCSSFQIRKTQAELADKIGFHLRSVQRSISALKKEGFLSDEKSKITISKEQYLRLKDYIEERGGIINEKI